MWLWLSFRPWWVQWPVNTLLLTVLVIPFAMIVDYPDRRLFSHWDGRWVGGGVIFAALMGLLLARNSARRLAELPPVATQLSVPACRVVSKALKSGPVPADADIRDLAVQLGASILRSSARTAKVVPAAAVLVVLSQVALFLAEPHHFTGLGLVMAVLLSAQGAYTWLYPHLIEARLQLLRLYSPP